MPAAPVSLDDQIRWAEAAAKRNRDYWQGQVRLRKAGEAYAAQQIKLGDAVVESLKRIAYGELG